MAVSKSTDGGLTWARRPFSSGTRGLATELAFHPNDYNTLFAGGIISGIGGVLYKTTDCGSNWYDITNGIVDTVYSLAISRNDPNIMYAATPSGLYKTTDGGSNWDNRGCSGARVVILHPQMHCEDSLFVGTTNGVYCSGDAGYSFVEMREGLSNTKVISLVVTQNSPLILFAGTYGSAIFKWTFGVGLSESKSESKKVERDLHTIIGRRIEYNLPFATEVKLEVYTSDGRKLCNIERGKEEVGNHSLELNIDKGIYFIKIKPLGRRLKVIAF